VLEQSTHIWAPNADPGGGGGPPHNKGLPRLTSTVAPAGIVTGLEVATVAQEVPGVFAINVTCTAHVYVLLTVIVCARAAKPSTASTSINNSFFIADFFEVKMVIAL